MFEPLSGGCLCGAMRYQITRTPIDAGYCHCRLCQRSSGAPVLAWLTVASEGFHYTRGEPASYRSSARCQREFCPHCGTQLRFRAVGNPAAVDITIASLDNPAAVPPQYHIWTQSQVSWLHTDDDLPRHEDAGPDRNS